MRTITRRIICCVFGFAFMALSTAAGCYFSEAAVNTSKYPVWGVDVSNWQGTIDWQKLHSQGVSFAFIKATEGSGHTNDSIRYNLDNASETGIKISAYHFFSFDSSGETQAANYIASVGKDEIDMPPVVDIEYYGDKKIHKPSSEETEAILRPLLERLEEYYGVKPIIYTTIPAYFRYVKSEFSDYPLWIRSVNFEPDLMDWQFWQYCDHGKLDGYEGDEQYIDLNVYCGSRREFEEQFG